MAGSLKPILVPAALGAGGGLKVDGSGTALPVSGTVAATQSGTFTVQPGNTANTTAWKVDGSAVTQPMSAAALPLPSGASTSAIQTANGVLLGAVTETAPATDIASSGINGRLQRIAQRITSLIALVPSALTGSGNFKVSIQEYGSGSAATPTTDGLGAFLATNSIMNGVTALTPKFAKANVAASQTDSSVVALVSSKKLRVLGFRLHAGATATTVVFQSNSTAISEVFALAANGGRAEAFTPVGHFETASGEALKVTTGAGATTGIGVVYVEV